MAVQAPKLKRGLLGYRVRLVRAVLAEREGRFAEVSRRLEQAEAARDGAFADLEAARADIEAERQRARQAEEEGVRLAEEAKAARTEASELRSVNETLRGRIDELEAAASSLGADLWTALDAAERSVTAVIERARRENEAQLEAIEAARRELREETERMATWRAEADGVIEHVRAALEQLVDITPGPGGPEGGTSVRTVRLPSRNGAVGGDDLAAIQELYGSSP